MKIILNFIAILLIAGCASISTTKKQVKSLPDFDTLWDYNDPEQTEIKFRELIPIAKESGDVSYYAQLLTQIARTEGLQRKFEDAHKTLDIIEPLLTNELVVARVRYLLERGRVYNSSNHPDRAKPLFSEAWKLAEVNKEDFYAIDAVHMLQIIEVPEKKLEWANIAIEMAEKTTDERAKNWLGSLYNNTGWAYNGLKQYDKALEMFKKSLKWQEEKGDVYGTIIAKWTTARTYRSLDRIDEALEIQRALAKEIEQKGLETDGYVYEELGECLLLLEKKEEARKYFKIAYDFLSKNEWLKANEPERLERLKELGGN
ncbi:MAG: tetratricopeptide repeat protein [Candidatus Stahlbacteria bacterium]|nr:MAG: tetratricopeptide repeat protein [Candidatus Stahlbacteria bacterium]